MHRIMKIMKKTAVSLLLVVILLASSWVLLRPGFFRAHDYIHAARIAEMTRALQDGHLPVRWSQNFGYGYGMPLFEFYAPLPFYSGSLFYWLSGSALLAVKLLFFISNLITLLGAYYLGRKLFGSTGGVVTAAALTLAPYRAVNLFVRGALSEAWGIMVLPWILYGLVLVADTQANTQAKRKGWVILVLCLVVLMLSHNLTTLMFVPLSVLFGGVYLFYRWSQSNSNFQLDKKIFLLAGSYFLAIGLAAFYLFPALVEKNFTKIDSILGGYFHYSQHFLYIRQFFLPNWGYGGSQWGPDDGISFFLGFGQLAALLVTSVFFLFSLAKKQFDKKTIVFLTSAGLFGFSLFMTTFKSEFIWNQISFLSFIQFPWRWMAPAIVFLALLAGLGVSYLKRKFYRVMYAWLLVIFLVVTNFYYFQPETFLEDPNTLYYTEASRIQSHMSGILPDYIPIQMPDQLVPPLSVVEESDQVNLLVNSTHQKLVSTTFAQPTTLAFAVADFPGWTVEIDGQQSTDAKQVSTQGTITVEIPEGEHTVGLLFGTTPIRQASDLITGLSLLLFGFLVIRSSYENS